MYTYCYTYALYVYLNDKIFVIEKRNKSEIKIDHSLNYTTTSNGQYIVYSSMAQLVACLTLTSNSWGFEPHCGLKILMLQFRL